MKPCSIIWTFKQRLRIIALLTVVLVCLPRLLWGQNDPEVVQITPLTDTLTVGDSLRVSNITLLGAMKTRPWVIMRELTFERFKTYDGGDLKQELERSQRNLYNLGLFNEVILTPQISNQQVTVVILVKERWYLFGSPTLQLDERNNYDLFEAIRRLDFRRAVFGLDLSWRNVTGQNENLVFAARIGFKQRFSINYTLPAAFRKQNIDLNVGFGFGSNDEILIGTDSGRVVWQRLETQLIQRNIGGVIGLKKRFDPYRFLSLSLKYQHLAFSDSLYDFRINDETVRFATQNSGQEYYPTLSLAWYVDRRDLRSFPLSGYKYQLLAAYSGPEGPIGTTSFAKLGATWAHHIPFGERWNFAYGTHHILTIGDSIPWFDKSVVGIGRSDFSGTSTELRGYEPFAVLGTYVNLNKAELKFAIVPRRIVHLPFLPLRRFQDTPFGLYLSSFAETGYVYDKSFNHQDTFLTNRWLLGYGLGLNVIGFYDMLLRVEYSRNHLGMGGIYLNGTVPIK
ncbi:MAG: BamA/TamA family outer membrane protein [Bacteroidota bacterium]